MILALGDLGDLACDQVDYARALEFYREALELGRAIPAPAWSPRWSRPGIVAAAEGHTERGARLLGAAEAIATDRVALSGGEDQGAREQAVAAVRAALGETGSRRRGTLAGG